MLEKQQKLFVQGYNLEVHDVIKYTRKHHATVSLSTLLIISGASHVLHDVSCNRLIVTFGEIHTLLKEYRRTRKGMKDKRNRHGAVGKSSSEQHFRKSSAITFIV